MNTIFSFARLGALLMKEFIQMRRDRITFAMMLGVPLMQLVLFGYAINNDPKSCPPRSSPPATTTIRGRWFRPADDRLLPLRPCRPERGGSGGADGERRRRLPGHHPRRLRPPYRKRQQATDTDRG